MATKVLTRPSLYDDDFLAWCEQQAALLHAGRLDELDIPNVAEELEAMARSEWGELENRLEVLLMHMLKWDHQPEHRSGSWRGTIREQRSAIARLLKRSPSLRPALARTIAEVYPDALGRAVDETGLEPAAFPEALPYTVDQVLTQEPLGGDSPATRRGRRRRS